MPIQPQRDTKTMLNTKDKTF